MGRIGDHLAQDLFVVEALNNVRGRDFEFFVGALEVQLGGGIAVDGDDARTRVYRPDTA
jgi:hypothetical protein